jgi:type IV pilus assembly protein PilP
MRGLCANRRVVALLVVLSAGGYGCGEDDDLGRAQSRGLGLANGAAAGAGAQAASAESGAPTEVAARVFRDSDFVESEHNRDPFRNFTVEFKSKDPVVAQRTVVMPNTPVSQMRIIAIITRIDQPRAMIVDEKGVGHVTRRGDFVGRADVVQTGGAENLPVALNWRIDRIRENEVILAREDPTAPGRPPLTRILPLHVEEENANSVSVAENSEG